VRSQAKKQFSAVIRANPISFAPFVAAGQFRRVFAAHIRAQAHHFQLGEGDFVHQPQILAHRELHVLQRGERGEKRALLEQHAPPLARAKRCKIAADWAWQLTMREFYSTKGIWVRHSESAVSSGMWARCADGYHQTKAI